MTADMWLQPAAVRDAAPEVEAVAVGVSGILNRLSSVLDAEGACWGTDAMGAAFGDSYAPAVRDVRSAFGNLAIGIEEVATALRRAAENAADSDFRAENRLS